MEILTLEGIYVFSGQEAKEAARFIRPIHCRF